MPWFVPRLAYALGVDTLSHALSHSVPGELRNGLLVNDNYSSSPVTIRIPHWCRDGKLAGMGQLREGEARPELPHPGGA